MRFVDQQIRAVRAAHVDDLAQRGDVASNRVQPFDDHETVALRARQPFQLLTQALRRIVTEPDHLGRRLPRGVVNARVTVAVDQDDVVRRRRGRR